MNKATKIWLYNVGGIFTVTIEREDGTDRTYTPRCKSVADRVCRIAHDLWVQGWVIRPFALAHGYTLEAA